MSSNEKCLVHGNASADAELNKKKKKNIMSHNIQNNCRFLFTIEVIDSFFSLQYFIYLQRILRTRNQ